jgi:hypothetical protein
VSVFGVNGGKPKVLRAHALFFIFYEFVSKGGAPFLKKMVTLGCWLYREGFSRLKIIFPT